MDTKIQKYAKWCEIAAQMLIFLVIIQWPIKWVADWLIYGIGYFDHSADSFNLWQYKSLAEALEKLPIEQSGRLYFVDIVLQADYSSAWLGLANLARLPWIFRLIGFLADGVSVGILVIGFYLFIKLMKQLKKGSLFSVDVIELLSKIAKVIFWFALYTPINRTIISLLLAFNNPVGKRFWVATVNFHDILTITISWFFVILTSLMCESQQLKEEHDSTV